MKSGLRAMSGGGQDIGIVLDPNFDVAGTHTSNAPSEATSLHQSTHTHSRSRSWSFNARGGQRGDLTASLAAMNPITSVIREMVVPSFVQETTSSRDASPLRMSRASSQISLPLNSGSLYDSELNPEQSREPSSPLSLTHTHTNSHPLPHRSVGARTDGGGAERGGGGGGGGGGGNGNDEQQNIGFEISDGVRWLEHNAIFIVLLLLKFAWYHRSGLMVILGMLGTYLHCNTTIRTQVSLKNRREKSVLILVILFLAGNIYFVYYVFREQRLQNCLIFKSPNFGIDLWNLLWSICVTDYIVRFGTMAVKATVAACFVFLLPSRKKGKYYMLLEYISQFYRNLLPLPLWFRYLSNAHHSGAIFAIIITAAYLMIKGGVTFARVRELYRALIEFVRDPMYGTTPTKEDILQSTNICPICQESFELPILLKCRHIFCEDCVLQWFDRQSTCPLCRASIASNPKWRDGSTAAWPNLF